MNGMKITDLRETKCEVCGKTICLLCAENWAYKRQHGKNSKVYYCCSWSCLQQLPAKQENGKWARKGKEILSMLNAGKTTDEIVKETGVTSTTVRYWQKKYAV